MNEITNVFFNQRHPYRTTDPAKPGNASKISPNKTRASAENRHEEYSNPTIDRLKLTEDVIRNVTHCDSLAELQELDLTGNSKLLKYRIRYISGLQNALNLRELNLSNNDIEKIDGLSSLKKLRILNLSGNKITKIEGISGLKSLEIANLSENLIEAIPQTITLCQSLTTLNLANNNISKKEDINNLRPLAKLGILNLSNNPVSELHDYYTYAISQLKRLIYLDGQVVQKNPGKRFSAQDTKSSPRYTTSSQTVGDVRSPDRTSENMSDSYERRLHSAHNKLSKIALLNHNAHHGDKNSSSRLYREAEENSVTEFANGNSSGSAYGIGFANHHDNDRRNSSIPKNKIPGLKLGQEGVLNDNTLYSYSESMLDTKKNTPLVSNRGKPGRYGDKENQDVDLSNINHMDLSNNGNASQLNLSSIEQISPNETSRAEKSFNQRERENIIIKMREIFNNIYQEHGKIDYKAQEFNQIYEEIRLKKNTINGLVQSLSQVLNIIHDANQESETRAEKEEVIKKRHDLIAKIKDLLTFEEEQTRAQISYYSLQSKIKSIQITNRTEEVSNLLKELERECDTLKEKLQSSLYSLDLISLDIIKIEATVKTKLRGIPDGDQNDEFQPENQAINTHFKQLSQKVHGLEKDIQAKLQVFDSIRESFITVLRGTKTLLNLKINEQIDLALIQTIQKEFEPKIKVIIPMGDSFSQDTSNPPSSERFSSNRKQGPSFKYFQAPRALTSSSMERDKENSVPKESRDMTKKSPATVSKQIPFYMNLSSQSKVCRNLNKTSESSVQGESFVFQGSTEQEGTITSRGGTTNRGNETKRNEKDKTEFYKNFQNPWEGLPREEPACQDCKKKEKSITNLQEELINCQKRVFEAQEEIAKLNKLLSDQRNTHESQIVSMQSILEASTKMIQEEKQNYERNLNNFAEICDKNTFKISEIHSKLDHIIKKPETNYSSQKWIIEAQASAFEGLIMHNQELNNTLKGLILDYRAISQGQHAPATTERERKSLTLAPGSNKVSESSDHLDNTTQQDQEETIQNFFTQRSNTEKMINISNINMSKPSQFESCPNILEIPYSETNNDNSKLPEFEESKRENLALFASQCVFSQPHTTTNRSMESYPSSRFVDPPSSLNPQNLEEKTLGSSKASRELLEKIKEFTISKKSYQPGNAVTQADKIVILNSGVSVKHEDLSNHLQNGLHHVNTVPRFIHHSKSNSLNSLQKILFGTQGTEDTIIEKPLGETMSPRSMMHSGIAGQTQDQIKTAKGKHEYFDAAKRFNIFKQRSLTPPPDDHSDFHMSNLQESIALHLIETSKRDSEKVLRKVSSNIQNYKLLTQKDRSPLDRSTVSKGKGQLDRSQNNYFVSPVKFPNMTSPGPELEKSPMSVRGTMNTATKQTNTSMASSSKGSYHLDYKKVYRKPADYQSNSQRGMSANYVNFINQKRKLLESPDIAHYSEKFDFSSPYHPMYAHSMIEGNNNGKTNVSNFSATSNSRNSFGGRLSFMGQVQSDQNKILSDH